MQASRHRFWISAVLAVLAAFLGLLTFVWQSWIEGTTGLEPDGGSGAFEWAVVATCGVASLALSGFARREWVRLHEGEPPAVSA